VFVNDNLFFKDYEAKSESRKEDIEQSRIADSDDEYETAFNETSRKYYGYA
jgi:hypothetical protein